MKQHPYSSNGDAYDQAAAWYLRLSRGEPDQAVRAEFDRWREHGENAAAFAAVERSWNLGGNASRARDSGPESSALQRMLADAHGYPNDRIKRVRRALVAVGLLVTGGIGLILMDGLGQSGPAAPVAQTYVTEVGERSTLTLHDGSLVSLNTDSRLRADLTGPTRRLTLLGGQALFDVAHDPERPFVVQAGDHQVVALGTSFDVRLGADSLQVTLIEGSVRVEDSAHPPRLPRQPTKLDPGEQFLAEAAQAPQIRPARVEQVTSWREGRIIFSDEPLEEAVAEVNRYSTRKLVLADESLRSLRISGVFNAGRPDSFAAAITSHFSIDAAHDPSTGDLVLHASPSG